MISKGNALLACSANPNQKAACCLFWSGSVLAPPDVAANANPVALAIMYESSTSEEVVSAERSAGLSQPVIFNIV